MLISFWFWILALAGPHLDGVHSDDGGAARRDTFDLSQRPHPDITTGSQGGEPAFKRNPDYTL